MNYITHFTRAIEDFQSPGETDTFVEHIRLGLKTLSLEPDSLLVFSGSRISPTLSPSTLG